ncbi:hypothetical protein GWK47_006939 [Chionoecetes opilio]|uniref:Uncharacterized protein n=1 Tax=Chionoecetes opilio TaxID=41210 RepID=A0A8J4YC54_CHIOP|nr:hypothetical protein GWK47_006939 [Chionoecetes opilio]
MLAGTHALVEHTYFARLWLQSYPEAPSWYIMREPLMTGALQCYFRRHTPWKYSLTTVSGAWWRAACFPQWAKFHLSSRPRLAVFASPHWRRRGVGRQSCARHQKVPGQCRPLAAPRTQHLEIAMPSAAISCLLKLILVSGTVYTAASGDKLHDRQLQVLGEVVSGPARGRPLTLHLDAALPADVQQAVLEVEAVRRAPRLTMSLSLNHSHGQLSRHGGPGGSFSSRPLFLFLQLHVCGFTPQPSCCRPHCGSMKNPENLLLPTWVRPLGPEVLRAEAKNRGAPGFGEALGNQVWLQLQRPGGQSVPALPRPRAARVPRALGPPAAGSSPPPPQPPGGHLPQPRVPRAPELGRLADVLWGWLQR